MSTIALQLELPESAFQELQRKAAEANKSVPQYALELMLASLERQAKLEQGRALLRALPRQVTEEAKDLNLPSDLAEKHDEYLTKPRS